MSAATTVSSALLILASVGLGGLLEKRPPPAFRDRILKPYVLLHACIVVLWLAAMGFSWPALGVMTILGFLTAWTLLRRMRTCARCKAITVSQDLLRPATRCRTCGSQLGEGSASSA
jgi:hypothetical protein